MPKHDDCKIEFTGGALDTIERCLQRISDVTHWHGTDEGQRIGESFATCFGRLLLNSERIMWDGDLSLISHWRMGLVVGMNFSPDSLDAVFIRAGQAPAQARAILGDDTIAAMPATGTWSLNS